MHWLMDVLLVSLGALLFAAVGVARHIWLLRGKLRRAPSVAIEPAEESDLKLNS